MFPKLYCLPRELIMRASSRQFSPLMAAALVLGSGGQSSHGQDASQGGVPVEGNTLDQHDPSNNASQPRLNTVLPTPGTGTFTNAVPNPDGGSSQNQPRFNPVPVPETTLPPPTSPPPTPQT